MKRHRHSRGTPAGGQFAPTSLPRQITTKLLSLVKTEQDVDAPASVSNFPIFCKMNGHRWIRIACAGNGTLDLETGIISCDKSWCKTCKWKCKDCGLIPTRWPQAIAQQWLGILDFRVGYLQTVGTACETQSATLDSPNHIWVPITVKIREVIWKHRRVGWSCSKCGYKFYYSSLRDAWIPYKGDDWQQDAVI